MAGLLTEVLLRGLPTRNDRLQEDRVLIFDERHQIYIVLTSENENALAAITLGVRVLQDIEQVASLDGGRRFLRTRCRAPS
jgi:Rad3-related DNA helicase